MKKLLNLAAWISAGAGVLLILFAVVSSFTENNILGFEHRVNYFTAASTFFLITIALFLYLYRCQCNKD